MNNDEEEQIPNLNKHESELRKHRKKRKIKSKMSKRSRKKNRR
jgi:hypothetical protein